MVGRWDGNKDVSLKQEVGLDMAHIIRRDDRYLCRIQGVYGLYVVYKGGRARRYEGR